MADPPLVVVSNRGPLSFTRRARRAASRPDAGRRRARVGPGPARGRHRHHLDRRRAVPGRPRGRSRRRDRGRGLPCPHARARPRGPAAGLRRGVQRHPLVRAPRALRARPRAVVRPRLVGRLERLRAGQRGLRAGGDGGRAGGRHRPRAGLPPRPARPASSAPSAPTCDSVHFSHTPFAGPDGLRVLPPGAPTGAARGDGRAPRLRLPHPALGGGVRGLVRRRRRDPAARRSCRRSPRIPTTSRRPRARSPASTRWPGSTACSATGC